MSPYICAIEGPKTGRIAMCLRIGGAVTPVFVFSPLNKVSPQGQDANPNNNRFCVFCKSDVNGF